MKLHDYLKCVENSPISPEEKEAYKYIIDIRNKISSAADFILESLHGALSLIELMFVHPAHFLLEFIQNAEDANANTVKVILTKDFVEIYNDGKPFDKKDVESICSVGKSYKDPSEYIGYLGVGFKSVFKISDAPHIYSWPYRFKFDKNCWKNADNIPWQVIPIWINKYPDKYRKWNTVFYIPLKGEGYDILKKEIYSFAPTTLLFLRNIKQLDFTCDSTKITYTKVIEKRKKIKENEEYEVCIIHKHANNKVSENKWLVFKRIVNVPKEVQKDPLTVKFRRNNVKKREIAVAFSLDEENNLQPITGTIKFGVFSYVPLREEEAGIPFIIHGDFLVAPGREAIHREARWNLWLFQEIVNFILRSIIPIFKRHSKWKYQYLSVLYSEPYISFIRELLSEKINKELMSGRYLIDLKENFVSLDNVIDVSERLLNIFGADFLEKLTGKKIIHNKMKLPEKMMSLISEKYYDVRSMSKLFQNAERIKEKFGEKWIDAYKQFIIAMAEEAKDKGTWGKMQYRVETYVIGEDYNAYPASEIYVPENEDVIRYVKSRNLRYKFICKELLEDKDVINALKILDIPVLTLKELKEKEKREIIRKRIPELIKEFEKASDQRKIEILFEIKEIWEKGLLDVIENVKDSILVRTKSGKWLKPTFLAFSSKYNPEIDLEKFRKSNLLDFELEFVDDAFIRNANEEEIRKWKSFFKFLGVSEGREFIDANGNKIPREKIVQRIGILAAIKYIKNEIKPEEIHEITESESGLGYDISYTKAGKKYYVEVKARAGTSGEIQLTANEYNFLITHAEQSYLFVVLNALKEPELLVIPATKLRELFEKQKLKVNINIRNLREISQAVLKIPT